MGIKANSRIRLKNIDVRHGVDELTLREFGFTDHEVTDAEIHPNGRIYVDSPRDMPEHGIKAGDTGEVSGVECTILAN